MNQEEQAFKLILHGGNARGEAYEAIDLAEEFKFEEAEEKIKAAEAEMKEGHQYQTEAVRASDEGINATFLMIHAQDHLMTALAEMNMAKRFIETNRKMYELEQRLAKLES